MPPLRRGIVAPALFRLRVLLRVTASAKLHPLQGPTVYALLSAANAHGDGPPALPDGLLLMAPEQMRIHARSGEPYALGFTLLDDDATSAQRRLVRLIEGLRRVGATGKARGWGLGGNFQVASVEDLVARRAWSEATAPVALHPQHWADEERRLAGLPFLTLRFVSPLRMRRSAGETSTHHSYLDGEAFPAARFVLRLARRLEDVGLLPSEDLPAGSDEPPETVGNRLVWIDLPYGPAQRRKTLGGAAGRVRLRVPGAAARRVLVLGQYVGAGESTRFGLGAYRIEELGPDPFPCPRGAGLLDLALVERAVDVAAGAANLPGGQLRAAAAELRAGRYAVPAPSTLTLRAPGRRERRLAIPPPADRALQRLLHDLLAPALDLFFEHSSFAYRRGLSRATAAERIAEAEARGYRHAVRSDFRRFFDEVDHDLLFTRLEAFLADDACVAAVRAWVARGAPEPGKGLPTGSPLSPLLANLLLDAFDEEIARDGGVLVRYADDFVILTRTAEEAERLFLEAREAARALCLELNESKSSALELRGPFEFLGFTFRREGAWSVEPREGPRPLESLGWEQSAPKAATEQGRVLLPGEVLRAPPRAQAVVVVRPGVASLDVADGDLLIERREGGPAQRVPLPRIEQLVLLSVPAFSAGALSALLNRGVRVVFAGAAHRPGAVLEPAPDAESGTAHAAQVDASRSEPRRLVVARALIAAKIRGYAALARATGAGDNAAGLLAAVAERVPAAPDVAVVEGLEGHAAALWYGRFEARLPRPHRFQRRVAPEAADPINVLLNLGQTLLHRAAITAARTAGLLPAVGLLHRPRSGHAALASDLQEPYRHLVDRAVLEAAPHLGPEAFERVEEGSRRLRLRGDAGRAFLEVLYRGLLTHVGPFDATEPATYLDRLHADARSLRAHLLDPTQAFVPYSPPGSPP